MKLMFVCGSDPISLRSRLLHLVDEVRRRHGCDLWSVIGHDDLAKAVGTIVGRPPLGVEDDDPPAFAFFKSLRRDPDALVVEAYERGGRPEGRVVGHFSRTLPTVCRHAAEGGFLVLAELLAGTMEEAVRIIADANPERWNWNDTFVCEFDGTSFDLSREVDERIALTTA